MHGAERLIDIAFLHASPKFCGNESLAELNFQAEMKGIKRAIADSHKSVKFKQVLGTLENFKFIVTMKPHVLHITCHGDYAKGNSTGTLTLETEDGDGRHINQEDLLYNLKL